MLPNRTWVWAGALVLVAAVGLILLIPRGDRRSESGGQVKIVSPLPSPSPSAEHTTMPPIPVARENGRKAEEQSLAVAYEKRDADWAPRSEGAIRDFIRGFGHIAADRPLKVKCALSACEVTGIASPDPATGELQSVWDAIERDTAGAELRAYGLERTAAVFDTGRSADEFRIYYRRVVAAP